MLLLHDDAATAAMDSLFKYGHVILSLCERSFLLTSISRPVQKTSSILFAGLLERAILPEATGRCKRLVAMGTIQRKFQLFLLGMENP